MDCPVCSSRDLKKVPTHNEQVYFICKECQYLFLEPSLRIGSSDEKARYEEHNNDLDDPKYLNYLQKTWDKISSQVSKGSLVVDYGCGPTKGLEAVLRLEDYQVISYDPIFFPSGLELFFGNVDVVYCSEAIEHMFQPLTEFKTWIRLLKPGGLITLRTSFHSGVEEFADWHYKNDPTHIGFFNQKTFEHLAGKFGLEILHIRSPYASFRKKKLSVFEVGE